MIFGTLYAFAYHIPIIFNNGIKPDCTHVVKDGYPLFIRYFSDILPLR